MEIRQKIQRLLEMQELTTIIITTRLKLMIKWELVSMKYLEYVMN